MKRGVALFYNFAALAIAAVTLTVALPIWADVPAPPVNQSMSMPDVWLGDQQEAFCLGCHSSGVPPLRGTSPHHARQDAQNRHCTICHGSVVSDYDDGHYIPTYYPSLVTPLTGGGEGLPANSRGTGAGGCKYCHDDAPPIRTNEQLHHDTAFYTPDKCSWCHSDPSPLGEAPVRRCENCHGPTSLHNIQAESPKASSIGSIVVGGEDAGYGHVGRDAGPGDSDCWGCHGFLTAATATAPAASGPSGPMPVAGSTLYEADCRGCHASGVLNRHHLLYGQGPIPAGSVVPYPDSDGNGRPDIIYVCLSCHGYNFSVVRDCTQCHSATNPHGSVCWSPAECDDGIACTNDLCNPETRECQHLSKCGDGIIQAECGEQCDGSDAGCGPGNRCDLGECVCETTVPIPAKIILIKFGGTPRVGKAVKIVSKGAFMLPTPPNDPETLGGSVTFDVGLLGSINCSLPAGAFDGTKGWKSLGKPAGSKGYKYTNKSAPSDDPCKVVLIKGTVIKAVLKGTQSLLPPLDKGLNPDLSVVLQAGSDRYCAYATAPHFKEKLDTLIKANDQPAPAPAACP